MIRAIFIAIERWVWDDESSLLSVLKAMLVICCLFAIIAAPIVWLVDRSEDTEQNRCLASGRGWAIVGHHTALVPMLVGKVIISQPRNITDYGCVDVVRGGVR